MEIEKLIGETTAYDKKLTLEDKKPKSWLKSVSAFANGKGGILFFGIANDDTLVGLTDTQTISEKISEIIKMILSHRQTWKSMKKMGSGLLFFVYHQEWKPRIIMWVMGAEWHLYVSVMKVYQLGQLS